MVMSLSVTFVALGRESIVFDRDQKQTVGAGAFAVQAGGDAIVGNIVRPTKDTRHV